MVVESLLAQLIFTRIYKSVVSQEKGNAVSSVLGLFGKTHILSELGWWLDFPIILVLKHQALEGIPD